MFLSVRNLTLRLLTFGKLIVLPVLVLHLLEYLVFQIFEKKIEPFKLQQCFLDELPPTIADKEISNESFTSQNLEDILLSDIKPIPGRAIFFLETKCNYFEPQIFVNLTARQACSIESAALHNPNFQIFVIFANPKTIDDQNPFVNIIRGYKNVHLRQLNIWRYVAGTPVQDWILNQNKFETFFPTEHTSDLLRLLTIYRYGGIYLDMDVVLLRSLEQIPMNYVGAQVTYEISNAVISLEPTGIGHEIGGLFLRNFQETFNGSDYLNNGPRLIQRVLEKICNTENVEEMIDNPDRCHGLRLFNPNAFYVLQNLTYLFDTRRIDEALDMTKKSYLIHLWNKRSHKCHLRVGSNTAYGKYAEQNCPKSYAAAGEYF